MKISSLNLVICAFAIINNVSAMQPWELRGDAYQGQLAKDKYATIWSQVSYDTNSKPIYQNTLNQMLSEDAHPTLDWLSDTVPYDDFWGKRQKFIHTQGVVGAVKFVPAKDLKTTYTGLLSSGADYGFIRFSTGPPFDSTKPAKGNFSPGFGLKFLRDGVPSSNLVAAPIGQDNWNFFSKDFANQQAMPGDPVRSHFKTATDYPHRVALKDFTQYDQTGAYVQNPVFPFKLVFSPSDSVKSLFPDDFTAPFTQQLSTLTKGTVLFNIYTQAEPNADNVLLGTLELLENATTSKFGDDYLWFKHQDTKYDVEGHPDWKKFLLPDSEAVHEKDIDASSFQSNEPQEDAPSGCPFQRMKKAINDMKKDAKNFLQNE